MGRAQNTQRGIATDNFSLVTRAHARSGEDVRAQRRSEREAALVHGTLLDPALKDNLPPALFKAGLKDYAQALSARDRGEALSEYQRLLVERLPAQAFEWALPSAQAGVARLAAELGVPGLDGEELRALAPVAWLRACLERDYTHNAVVVAPSQEALGRDRIHRAAADALCEQLAGRADEVLDELSAHPDCRWKRQSDADAIKLDDSEWYMALLSALARESSAAHALGEQMRLHSQRVYCEVLMRERCQLPVSEAELRTADGVVRRVVRYIAAERSFDADAVCAELGAPEADIEPAVAQRVDSYLRARNAARSIDIVNDSQSEWAHACAQELYRRAVKPDPERALRALLASESDGERVQDWAARYAKLGALSELLSEDVWRIALLERTLGGPGSGGSRLAHGLRQELSRQLYAATRDSAL